MMKTHKDLEVWKVSMELVKDIYNLTSDFPKEEQYGLTSQLRRAAVSVPSNIAGGAARNHSKEFIQFLYIARGSLVEIETLLLLSEDLNYIGNGLSEKLLKRPISLINGLIKSIKT